MKPNIACGHPLPAVAEAAHQAWLKPILDRIYTQRYVIRDRDGVEVFVDAEVNQEFCDAFHAAHLAAHEIYLEQWKAGKPEPYRGPTIQEDEMNLNDRWAALMRRCRR